MFGVFRAAKARQAGAQALSPFVARPTAIGSWPTQFWQDPFVIGFIVYVIGFVLDLESVGKLTSEQRGKVFMGALQDAGGYSPDFMDRLNALAQAKDPDFMLGGRNAETVSTYLMNLHPMPGDPDVEAATKFG